MTLGPRHLAGSVVLLVCALAYNVWIFTRPARSVSAAQAGESAPAVVPTSNGEPPVLDGSEVTERHDVTLDRPPEWRRNPFAPAASVAQDAPAPAAAEQVEAPEAEADLTVGSILYSAERRYARVNGRIVGVGDRVGSARIVDILPAAVVVETARGKRIIETRPFAARGPR